MKLSTKIAMILSAISMLMCLVSIIIFCIKNIDKDYIQGTAEPIIYIYEIDDYYRPVMVYSKVLKSGDETNIHQPDWICKKDGKYKFIISY